MLNKRVRQLISAYIDGELSARKRRAVHQMIQSDPEARALYQQLKADSYYLKGVPRVSLPQDFSKRILSQIAEKGIQPRPTTRRPVIGWARLAVAATILLAIGVASYLYFTGVFHPTDAGQPNPGLANKHKQPDPKTPAPKQDPDNPDDNGNPDQEELREPAQVESANGPKTTPPIPPQQVPPAPQENPKSGDEFASPDSIHSKPEASIRIERPRLSVLPLRELDRSESFRRLQEELQFDPHYRLELFTLDSYRAYERVQSIFKTHNIRLVAHSEAQARLKSQAKTDFAIYAEDLKPGELAGILQQLGADDKRLAVARPADGVFGRLVLNPLARHEMANLLNADTSLLSTRKSAPLGVDIRKPVSDNTADQVADGLGERPSTSVAAKPPRSALLLVNYPASRNRSASSIEEIKKFLENRKEVRPGTIQVFLVLQNQL